MNKTKKRNRKKQNQRTRPTDQINTIEPIPPVGIHRFLPNSNNAEFWIVGLLLICGIYQSIIYYQQLSVPDSDFPAFVSTSDALLHFKLPSSFKRLPMLGLMQIALSKFCPGPHPVLTAGWLLNGILHTLSVVLFYRVGKNLLGQNAFYFALLASINPWVLRMTTDPVAETALIFWTLITFDFLLRRSKWCYLLAACAAITRYEFAGLVVVAFIIDMLLCEDKRARIKSAVLAFLALLPLALWMLLWRVYKPDSGHYTGHFINTEGRIGFAYWKLLWQNTFGPLLQLPSMVKAGFGVTKVTSHEQAIQIRQNVQILNVVIYCITGAAFVWAAIYSAIKKHWKFWAILLFWACYVGIHSIRHNKTLPRYTMPAAWMTLLIVFYGFQSLWQFICEKRTPPRLLVTGLQIVAIIVAACWIMPLLPILPRTAEFSTRSASLAYVSIGVLMAYLLIRLRQSGKREPVKALAALVVCSLFIISNQFQVVQVLGSGNTNIEFRKLAMWYQEHAEQGEKMLTTMPGQVKLFIPAHKENIIHTNRIPGKTPQEFAQSCYKRQITYVVWDSRLGLAPNDSYYKKWNLQKTAPMRNPQDVGPFEYVDQIKINNRRYLHIFKLRPLPQMPADITPLPDVTK